MSAVKRAYRWLRSLFGSTLSFAMAGSMMLAAFVVLCLIYAFLSYNINAGMFKSRIDQIVADAGLRISTAQARFDQTAVSTGEQVQTVATDMLTSLLDTATGAGVVGVSLLRAAGEESAVVINDIGSEQWINSLITKSMRSNVEATHSQYWQSVALPAGSGKETYPGVVVGSTVNLPLAGVHELYLVYSLQSEQKTIDMVMRILLASSVVLVLLLGLAIGAITWRVMAPVRQTARAARRLADGNLDERVTVQGEDELAVLGESFNAMANSLQRQIVDMESLARLQQRFVSDVSHELRTPLTTIRMAGDVLYESRDEFTPVSRRSAELLHDQVERFDSMLADLLEISRHDAHAAQLEPTEADLCEVVESVLESSSHLAQRLGVELNLYGADSPCLVRMDARRIERVVRNLVLNAIEHAEGRPMEISIGKNEQAAAVRVVDHGVGMPEEVSKQVFRRFYRADPSRVRTTGGTGLGLAISLEDVYLHGGELMAWGELGVGSSFLMVLPLSAGAKMGPSPIPLIPEQMEPVLPTDPDELDELDELDESYLVGPEEIDELDRVDEFDDFAELDRILPAEPQPAESKPAESKINEPPADAGPAGNGGSDV